MNWTMAPVRGPDALIFEPQLPIPFHQTEPSHVKSGTSSLLAGRTHPTSCGTAYSLRHRSTLCRPSGKQRRHHPRGDGLEGRRGRRVVDPSIRGRQPDGPRRVLDGHLHRLRGDVRQRERYGELFGWRDRAGNRAVQRSCPLSTIPVADLRVEPAAEFASPTRSTIVPRSSVPNTMSVPAMAATETADTTTIAAHRFIASSIAFGARVLTTAHESRAQPGSGLGRPRRFGIRSRSCAVGESQTYERSPWR
jgi:hypothetical protein